MFENQLLPPSQKKENFEAAPTPIFTYANVYTATISYIFLQWLMTKGA